MVGLVYWNTEVDIFSEYRNLLSGILNFELPYQG